MLASDVTLHSWGCWVNKHISARFLSPCWHSCPPFQYIKFEVRVWMIPLSSVLFGIKISSHADKSSSSFSWVERLWYILSWISLVKYLRNRAYEKEYFPKWGKISAIWDNKEFSWVHCVHLFSLSVISSKEGSHHPKLLVIRPSTYLLLSLSSVLCKHRGEKKTRAVSA